MKHTLVHSPKHVSAPLVVISTDRRFCVKSELLDLIIHIDRFVAGYDTGIIVPKTIDYDALSASLRDVSDQLRAFRSEQEKDEREKEA